MTFEEQNMATNTRAEPSVLASPSRPAITLAEPNPVSPGAPIPLTGSDQAIKSPKSKVLAPDRTSPAAMPGDETKLVAKPRPRASRRKSPAKAGGIDQSSSETQGCSVDANSSGASPGNGALLRCEPQLTVSPIATHSGEPGRDAAVSALEPHTSTRRHEPISGGTPAAADDRAPSERETHTVVSPVIGEIIQLVRMRRRWHKAEKSLTLQGKALCRSWLGGDKDKANAAYDLAVAGKLDDPYLVMALMPFLTSKERFEHDRTGIEKTLRKLARTLPVWKAWAEGVKGLGDLRLAVIVGECGDIGTYKNPSCLWKRMGLAVISGGRQRRVTDAAEAFEHGYNPERRAIAYVMGTEVLKAQVRNVKDEDGARTDESRAIGPYGQLYLDRKVYEAAREGITKSHANNRAARYMVKRVLRDLYAAWRGGEAVGPEFPHPRPNASAEAAKAFETISGRA